MVVIEDDRMLLVKRGREPGKGLWAVPGGKVEWGEEMKEAARREVLEETGLVVEIGDIVWVGEAIGDDHHLVLIDFAARAVGGTLAAADDAEDVRWVPIAEADQLPLTTTMYDLVDTLRA